VRILLALERWPARHALLDPAIAMARLMQAAVTTLYVENEALLRYAALPFALEVDPYSGEPRRLDAATLERAWRAEAGRAQRALAASARRHEVQFSFSVARGTMPGIAERAAADADILVLGLFAAVGRLAGEREATDRRRASPGVLAYYSGGPEAARVVETAMRVAELSARPLTVLAPQSLRAAAEALVARVAAPPRLAGLAGADVGAFLDVVRREPEATVVLPYSAADALGLFRQALPAVRDRLFYVVK
jgi:hypothetical protein